MHTYFGGISALSSVGWAVDQSGTVSQQRMIITNCQKLVKELNRKKANLEWQRQEIQWSQAEIAEEFRKRIHDKTACNSKHKIT